MRSLLYRAAQSLAYTTPVHRWLGLGKAGFDKAYWDEKLSGSFKPYLGGTLSVETRNAIVLTLIQMTASATASKLLDVGCAAGSLARAPGAARYSYVGVDISEVAVSKGRELSPGCEFHVARLEDYKPVAEFDVIVLNEVLYYLPVTSAIAELVRYCKHLAPDGVLIVSMKDSPKSKAIFVACKKSFSWVNGILYQEKIEGPEYALRFDSKRPGYLIGVLKAL